MPVHPQGHVRSPHAGPPILAHQAFVTAPKIYDWLDGFEHQVTTAAQFNGGVVAGLGIWDLVSNPSFLSFPPGRTGRCLHVQEDGLTATNATRYVPLSQQRVFTGYFRAAAAPVGNSYIWVLSDAAGAQIARVRLNAAGTLTIGCIDGTGRTTASSVSDNAWHRLDLWVDSSAPSGTWVVHWAIDDVVGINATSNSGKVATDSRRITLGSTVAADSATVDWDDCSASSQSGDHPLGPQTVLVAYPTADGTYAHIGTNVIERQDDVDISAAATAFSLLDDWTPANISTDYVQQVAAGGGNYAEVTFDDIAGKPSAVMAYAALFASGGAPDNGTTRIVDGADATVVDIYAGDMSETSLHYRSVLVPPPGGSWSAARYNALKAWVGLSSDAIPAPRWAGLMLAYVSTAQTITGAAVISGAGAVAAVGVHLLRGAASVSGGGSISASGVHKGIGVAAISGTGTIAATAGASGGVWNSSTVTWNDVNWTWDGELVSGTTWIGQAALTGTGTLAVSLTKRIVLGAAAINGAGTVVAAGRRVKLGVAAISGTGSIAASYRGTVFGVAAIAGSGTILPTGKHIGVGGAAISGTGQIFAAPPGVKFGFAAITGQGGPEATGVVVPLIKVFIGAGAIIGGGTILVTDTVASVTGSAVPGRITTMGGPIPPTPSSW